MLLIPIALDALVLRSGGGRWARTAMKAPQTPPDGAPAERQRLLPEPFADLEEARPPGAYLHWALADGLTRLLPGADGQASQNAVPSRWLVLRLTGAAAPHRRLDAWLLPNVHAETPEVLDALALTEPVPAGEVERPLTSAGHGDLAWSAYFDNVTGRLGFHDPLEDATGPVAYLVCGWYTHEQLDPLQPPDDGPWSESAFRERLGELGWYAEGPVPDPIPTRSLYHGSAVAIAWPGTTWTGDGDGELSAEHGGAPDPADIEVAIGETIAAAVARLTAADEDAQELSRLVEGLTLHALGELAEADGPARLLSAVHASRFGEVPSAARRETIYLPPELLGDPLPVPVGGALDGSAGGGDLLDAVAAVRPEAREAARARRTAGSLDSVGRSSPRLFHPIDPCLAVAGAGRSYRHGGDARFDERGLRCRFAVQTVTALGPADGPAAPGADVLPDWDVPEMPPQVHALLEELASLDPGSAPDLDAGTEPSPVAAARAAWWESWGPSDGEDEEPPFAMAGEPPSPVAVTPPTRPWTPLHLDWELHWHPSPRGAHDWRLGELDYELAESGPVLGEPRTFRGRAELTPGGAAALEGVSETLADRDVLTGALTGFLDRVRGVPEGQLVPAPGGAPEEPYPVNPLRAGALELRRLRAVDTYGQVVDLLGSDESTPITPGRLRVHDDLAVPERPELVAQVPRFTAPARVLLRYIDAIDGEEEAGPGVSPLCGFLLPTPFDGTVAFLDADGRNLGRLLPDPSGPAWEEDPGLPAAMGRLPGRLIENTTLGALGDGVIGFDTAQRSGDGGGPTATALSALLRVLDTTRSAVDATGAAGDTHVSLLLGRPVAVLRARLTLEVHDEAAAEVNAATSVGVRLGSLVHLDDGLLGYYAREDFFRLHAIDPAVVELARPLPGREATDLGDYVDPTGVVWVHPGQPVELALLVAPGAAVRVTTGLLPAKEIGVRREWLDAWLGRLTPTLRVGLVLRDPRTTRLPVPAGVRGTWTWHRRPGPGDWASDPVVPATGDALLPDSAPDLSEGWLRVRLAPEPEFLPLAVAFRITCIEQRSPGARIAAVGGENPDGSRWTVRVGQAVRMMESGRFRFFVDVDGRDAEVLVGVSATGRRYLRTEMDTTEVNNLLSLPSCGA